MRNSSRIKVTAEVFTPDVIINQIFDQIPYEIWNDPTKIYLDPSCGGGNILHRYRQKLLQHGHSPENALKKIYGIDLMLDNVIETRQRLDRDGQYKEIVERNIVQANDLTYHYRFDGTLTDDIESVKEEYERIKKLN